MEFKGLQNLSVREIHQAFDQKLFTPGELTRELLKAAKSNPLNATISVCEERATQKAAEADKLLAKEGKVPRETQPLFGIPIAIKDIITVEGVRTTCGSRILENYIPPYTATSVQKLEGAGAVILAKTNLDEFGMGSSNENSAFGPVLFPTENHRDRVPGGSSGGSAAIVRAKGCTAALGTDTGGSIRLPANYCGVVGLKPSYGRISRYGQIAYASSLDQIGPLALNVEDAATLLDVMSGFDPLDSTSALVSPTQCRKAITQPIPWKKIRIGIPKEFFVGGLDPAVEKSIQKALNWFQAQGAQKVDISLPHMPYAIAVYYVVAVSEASSNLARYDGVRYGKRTVNAEEVRDLGEFYEGVRANFGAEVKRRIILGTFALSAGYSDAYYKRACQVRRKIKEDFDAAFEKVDVILGPVSPTTAFKVGEKTKDPLQMYLNDIFTVPVNLAGLPAMSIPCGVDEAGLPIGLQLIAPAFGEEKMVSLAQAFSKGVGHAS